MNNHGERKVNTTRNYERMLETDVLVIGTGLAGLRAAIEARRYGAEVLLADKVIIARNNTTAYSGGGFKAVLPGFLPADQMKGYRTPEDHSRDTVICGDYLGNQRRVEILAIEGPARVLELAEFGVEGFNATHQFRQPLRGGSAETIPMAEKCRKIGVKSLAATPICDLLLRDGVVIGDVGISLLKSQIITIKAGATILATGGACKIYERNNPTASSGGDGYALAYRAGAELIDMGLICFVPCVLAEPHPPQWSIIPSLGGHNGFLRNRFGHTFLDDYLHAHDTSTHHFQERYREQPGDVRETIARAMCLEVYEGRGVDGTVLLDFTEVPDQVWESDLQSVVNKYCLMRGLNLRERPVRVMPGAMTNLGGVRINEECETSLPGLYAAGEASGLLHGARRRQGNALTDCVVFGARAGRNGARWASNHAKMNPSSADVQVKRDRLNAFLSRSASEEGDPILVKKKIQSTMWEHVGPIRTAEGLQKAFDILTEIRNNNIPRLYASSTWRLKDAVEVANMIEAAEMVTRSALMRTESRGAHCRLDYPDTNNRDWLKNVILACKGDKMELWIEPVIVTRLQTPRTD